MAQDLYEPPEERPERVKSVARFRYRFSLVDSLVVIAVIGILISLLLPAVQSRPRRQHRPNRVVAPSPQVPVSAIPIPDEMKQIEEGMRIDALEQRERFQVLPERSRP